jgi:GxxExxY protein
MEENDISYIIRGAIFEVYNTLGPGLLESVYAAALTVELIERGLIVKREVPVPVFYKERKLELGFRIDLLVNDKVIIEIKSIESILPVHHKQVLTYLKVHNCKLGILVNFNCDVIKDNIYRKVNNL